MREVGMSPDSGSRGPLLGGRSSCTSFQNNESSVVCYSESGTFLGLGTVTGSVAIYIAFSLQVMVAVGTTLWEGYKLTVP